MKEIRLGTIGSGVIVHGILDNVARTDGIRLEAVYSRQEEKGKALAKEYGADKVYTDMEQFLQDPDIYVTDGSNGLREIRIVTDEHEETVNLQKDPNRLYYEVQALTALMLAEDREAFRTRLQTTYEAIRTVENMRKAAGLMFPGDE